MSHNPGSIPEPRYLAWIDLEMTGLNPDRDVILQAAIVVTEVATLRELDTLEATCAAPERALIGMSDIVRQMHQDSGLLRRVHESRTTVDALDRTALQHISAFCAPKEAALAGNSVWVDRMFIRRYLPLLHEFLHYRQVDVSSLKLMARAWFGERANFAKRERHLALDDVRESIAELSFYRDLFTQSS